MVLQNLHKISIEKCTSLSFYHKTPCVSIAFTNFSQNDRQKNAPPCGGACGGLIFVNLVILFLFGVPRGKLFHVIEKIGAVGVHSVEHCSNLSNVFPLRASLSVSLAHKRRKRELIEKRIPRLAAGRWCYFSSDLATQNCPPDTLQQFKLIFDHSNRRALGVSRVKQAVSSSMARMQAASAYLERQFFLITHAGIFFIS